ncbi:hypothetical protein CRYUN_Cryun22dG0043200 [Craigia yunnanensis]
MRGNHPGDLILALFSSSSPAFTQHTFLTGVLDQPLRPPRINQVAEGVVATVQLAFACLHANPHNRSTMQKISSALTTQWPPLSKPFSMTELGELSAH